MEHSEHTSTTSRWLTGLAIGSALVGGAVILAPHVLPAILGEGHDVVAADARFLLHTPEMTTDVAADAPYYLPITEAGSGIAGFINRAIANYVPFVGETIAKGGVPNMLATAATGIGGVMFGRFIKNNGDETSIKWGDIIQYAALATSALIALPTLITGIGMGLVYLTMEFGSSEMTEQVAGAVLDYSGVAGSNMAENVMMGASGAAAAIPHFLTCGVSIVPATLGFKLWADKKKDASPMDDVELKITLDAPTTSGAKRTGALRLIHAATGEPLTDEELAVVHTRKIHLFVVDQSLQDYHHIHPDATAQAGVFTFSFTPKSDAKYTAWADFTTLEDEKNRRISTTLPAETTRSVPAAIRMNSTAERDGLAFTWETAAPLRSGEDGMANITITQNGKVVEDLEPVMGAYAHLVGFGADGKSILHCHPLGVEPVHEGERGHGRLQFHITPENAGTTQFYLQFKRHGEDVFIPFGQTIAPPLQHTARAAASYPSHGTAHAH
jgi:hypothetical protein